MALIFIPAFAFRMTMLWSQPIQEVDIYRYLWDGAVTRAGVNPFLYPPQQIQQAPTGVQLPEQLEELVTMARSRAGLAEALHRVHFAELSTVYPPTSQAGFMLVDAVTPDNATLFTRVNIMRSWLILVEIGSSILVLLMLRQLGKPDGLTIVHAW